jgi:hypothetical protein
MTRIAVERLLAARLEVRVMDSRGTIARSAAVLTGRQRRASPDRATQPSGDSADPRRWARAFSGARVVVFPHFTRSTARQVLEVLAAGGVPFYRRPQSAATDVPSIATYHPQLAEVLEQVPDFGRMDEMLRTIRTFERDAAKSAALAPVREVVRARHSLAARLETIRLHFAAPPPRA